MEDNIEVRPRADRTTFTFKLVVEAPPEARVLDLSRIIDAISKVVPAGWKVKVKSPR